MAKISRSIKCSKCEVFTSDADYCKSCGELISHKKKVEIKIEKQKLERVVEAQHEIDNPNLAERLKQHPFFLYKIIGWILYSAFLLVSIIGGALAWFVTMVAAG